MRTRGGARFLLLFVGVGLASCAESTHQLERTGHGSDRSPAFTTTQAALPTISEPVSWSADNGPPPLFTQLRAAPAQFHGQTMTISGAVLKAKRLMGLTEIEILQLPTDESGRPTENLRRSQGRFLARQSTFLDPATLANGPVVTVRGVVEGELTRPLEAGADNYSYPIIAIGELTVWPSELLKPLGPSYITTQAGTVIQTPAAADTSFFALLGAAVHRFLEGFARSQANSTYRGYWGGYSGGSTSSSSSSSSSPSPPPPPPRTDIPPQFQKGR